MMIMTMSKKTISLILFLTLVTVGLLVLYFIAQGNKTETPQQQFPTPSVIVPNPRNKQPSLINYVVPGKTSLEQVKKILGAPSSEKQNGEITLLEYDTSYKNFSNEIAVKKQMAYYSVENVFTDDQYGTTQTFLDTYGSPSLILYQKDNVFFWHIFLKNGVGIETNDTEILQIIRFEPQGKNSFLNTVAKDLGMSEEQTRSEEAY